MKAFFKENKWTLIRLLISVLLIVAGALFEGPVPILSLIIYIFAYGISVYKIAWEAIQDLIKKKLFAEKALMTIASLGTMIIGELFEACLVLVLFILGELIEENARGTSEKAISRLEDLCEKQARLENGNIVPCSQVKVGDIIEIFPGERVPLDGTVVQGIGSVDTSVITGEAVPKDVRIGSEILSGYQNMHTPLKIKVIREYKQSAAQRIITIAREALNKKTKSERFITKFAKIYTPIVVILSVLVAILPPLIIYFVTGDASSFGEWIYKALAMLAISCPCALVISVPLAFARAIGYGAKHGILIKNTGVLDALREIDIIAFDKTGTLTKSELRVTKIETYGESSKIQLLELVAIAEQKSTHPIAVAVCAEAKKFNVLVSEGTNYKETIGSGVECDSVYGHIKAGNRLFVDTPAGILGTVYISLNGKYVGSLTVGDELKPNSKIAFDRLRKYGVRKRIILSGDKKQKVDLVAKTLIADLAYSNLKPEDKVSALEDILKDEPENTKIGYCGDGINDIPALARADVGISMGSVGSENAVEVSDVIIVDDNIEKVPKAIKIAKSAEGVAVFNIVFSLIVKASCLALLAIPGVGFTMLHAVIADVGTMIITLLNSLRSGK